MNNKDLWQQYQDYTRDLTTNARQLGFAAIAICWLFKLENFTFPKNIYFAIGFIVLFFIADILQSFFGALLLRFWTRCQEKEKWKETQSIEGEYNKPPWLDYPSFTLWWSKIVALLLGYFFIGIQVFI